MSAVEMCALRSNPFEIDKRSRISGDAACAVCGICVEALWDESEGIDSRAYLEAALARGGCEHWREPFVDVGNWLDPRTEDARKLDGDGDEAREGMGDTDPLTALLSALDRDGKPPLAWVVQWAPDGDVDAGIARAWAVSTDGLTMARELASLGRAPFLWSVMETPVDDALRLMIFNAAEVCALYATQPPDAEERIALYTQSSDMAMDALAKTSALLVPECRRETPPTLSELMRERR